MTDERPGSIPLYLAWIGVLSGTLLLVLGEVLPVRLSFIRPETLFLCLLEVELAFMLFAWPWFMPSLVRPDAPPRRASLGLLREVGLLVVASVPLMLMAANVSNVPSDEVLLALALVWVLGAFSACLFPVGREGGGAVGVWYVLGAFGLSAFLPFVAFVAHSLGVSDLRWCARVSPFWAAGRGEMAWPVAIFGVLAAALWAVPRRSGSTPA
jgi:hypothetical protein